jgi:hypothetical protein
VLGFTDLTVREPNGRYPTPQYSGVPYAVLWVLGSTLRHALGSAARAGGCAGEYLVHDTFHDLRKRIRAAWYHPRPPPSAPPAYSGVLTVRGACSGFSRRPSLGAACAAAGRDAFRRTPFFYAELMPLAFVPLTTASGEPQRRHIPLKLVKPITAPRAYQASSVPVTKSCKTNEPHNY